MCKTNIQLKWPENHVYLKRPYLFLIGLSVSIIFMHDYSEENFPSMNM